MGGLTHICSSGFSIFPKLENESELSKWKPRERQWLSVFQIVLALWIEPRCPCSFSQKTTQLLKVDYVTLRIEWLQSFSLGGNGDCFFHPPFNAPSAGTHHIYVLLKKVNDIPNMSSNTWSTVSSNPICVVKSKSLGNEIIEKTISSF